MTWLPMDMEFLENDKGGGLRQANALNGGEFVFGL